MSQINDQFGTDQNGGRDLELIEQLELSDQMGGRLRDLEFDAHAAIEKTEPNLQTNEISAVTEVRSETRGELSLSLPAALCDEELIREIQNIPNKMAFKIGDVAEMLNVKQYVLRYWESEFEILRPKKASNNQRMYTRKDVENAFIIRKLLHRDRFSIEGARAALKGLRSVVKSEIKIEKEFSTIQNKFDTALERALDRAEEVLVDIRRLRQLFH